MGAFPEHPTKKSLLENFLASMYNIPSSHDKETDSWWLRHLNILSELQKLHHLKLQGVGENFVLHSFWRTKMVWFHLDPVLTFPQKSSLAVSTKGAENTHFRLFINVLFGSIRSFLFARTRSVFPVATTLVLLRAEIISLSFVPALVQPDSHCPSPQ